ncbi:hypothetical protein M8542_22165 [Amycolatopsis sp. OK19-0408]|uniref:Uncharacterized protein n=1 Tax=Amycolatopsis iheyensis TaxID=2945988 RepID=A0A9X2NIP3_9PSEU|nr:hypothetical protein [Amycolatopsis iheyensis]MCR6485535.1 hypothetical protein [Amycolatopsis iheyensis]
MDPEDDVRAFLTGAAGGQQPPMRLEATDVIERGGRVRRRRKRWAVAGTSTATAVILAVAGFLAGHRAGPPDPVQPADPGLSTIGTTAPAPAPPTENVPATSIAPPPEAQPGRVPPSRATKAQEPTPSTSRRTVRPTAPPSANPTDTVPEVPKTTASR